MIYYFLSHSLMYLWGVLSGRGGGGGGGRRVDVEMWEGVTSLMSYLLSDIWQLFKIHESW